jgi:hypothetical protein
MEIKRDGTRGLGDKVNRTDVEGAQGRHCTFAREARKHHHGPRVARHQVAQRGQPVHFGHLDIERHDIWLELLNLEQRVEAVDRCPGQLHVGLGGNGFADNTTHES